MQWDHVKISSEGRREGCSLSPHSSLRLLLFISFYIGNIKSHLPRRYICKYPPRDEPSVREVCFLMYINCFQCKFYIFPAGFIAFDGDAANERIVYISDQVNVR